MLLALTGLRLAARVERGREHRRHGRVLEGLGAPVASPDLAGVVARSIVTLEGTLVATEGETSSHRPSIVSFHPYGTSFLDEPNVYAATHSDETARFAVDLDGGGRAILEGALQVLAGTAESEHTAPLDRAAQLGAEELSRARVRTRNGQFRVVGPGDRVRVRGAVAPAPDDEALYRARSKVVRMSPEASDVPGAPHAISVAASSPPLRRRLRPRRHLAPTLGAALLVGCVASFAVVRTAAHPVPLPAADGARAATGAAPACRARVIEDLEKNRWPAAVTAAEACDDPYANAVVHFTHGAFDRASAAFAEARAKDPTLAPSLTETEAHLFVHDVARAAEATHRMAAHFYPGPSTAEKRYLECIADLLDTRATQDKAAAAAASAPAVPGPSFKPTRKICSVRASTKYARELDSDSGEWPSVDDWPDRSGGRDHFTPAYEAVSLPYTAPLSPRARLVARPVGLERALLDRLILAKDGGRAAPETRPYGRRDLFSREEDDHYAMLTAFAAELVFFYAYAGFPERSAPYWPILDRAAALQESNPPRTFHRIAPAGDISHAWDDARAKDEAVMLTHVMSIAATAALFGDDPKRMKRYVAIGEPHSAHIVKQMARALDAGAGWEEPVDMQWSEHKALFDAGLTGDAAEVSKVLVAQGTTGRETLARILPHLRRNRPSLDGWFRESFPAPCLTCGASSLLGHLSDRREIARLLGAAEERERLRPAAARFVDAMTDPAIAFELDELETFFGRKR